MCVSIYTNTTIIGFVGEFIDPKSNMKNIYYTPVDSKWFRSDSYLPSKTKSDTVNPVDPKHGIHPTPLRQSVQRIGET